MKKVIKGSDSLAGILDGIDEVANVVKSTAGPMGKTVIIKFKDGMVFTKDGVTAARYTDVEGDEKQIGAQMVKEVCAKTLRTVGDGTTAAAILAQSMLHSVTDLTGNYDANEVRKGIDEVVDFAKKYIAEKATPIEGDMQLLKHVAMVSSNGDEEIAGLLFDAYTAIGVTGKLRVDESKGADTYIKHEEGVQFDKGFLSPVFVNTPHGRSEHKLAYVLICDFVISSMEDIKGAMEKAAMAGAPLVIIAADITGKALEGFAYNVQRANHSTHPTGLFGVAIKAPFHGEQQKEYLEDLAFITGATLIREETAGFTELPSGKALGAINGISVSRESTVILNDFKPDTLGDIKLKNHLDSLAKQLEAEESDVKKSYLKERIARITGKVATLYVGGVTDAEMSERRDRIDDARQAVQCAIEEGVVPGGAVMYRRIIGEFAKSLDHEFKPGNEIVLKALLAPFLQLCENTYADKWESKVNCDELDDHVHNFKTGVNIPDAENIILDPAKVQRTALENAASVAKVFLGTDFIVINS